MRFENKKERFKPYVIMAALGILPVTYVAIKAAPFWSEGLGGILNHLDAIKQNPIVLTKDTPHVIAVCLLLYAFALVIALSLYKRFHRAGVEHGSADYADIKKLQKKYNYSSPERIVFTQNYAMSTTKKDTDKHRRNYNILTIGGPGSGKTTGLVYPNLLEASGSYVVTDPKGEICRNTGEYMKSKGYKVRVLDLIEPCRSWGYNPFQYIREDDPEHVDDDVQKIVTAIYKATTPPNSQQLDPFWDEAGKMLLSSLMYLLVYFGKPEEKNFSMIMDLIRAGKIEDSEDDEAKSPLDILFDSIEAQYPNHICIRYYRNATSGAGKTLQSVQITLLSHLAKFELSSLAGMMQKDELELEKLATEPTVLYLKIPDNDTSYNFIVTLLYIQLFQVLYDLADNVYHGRLPLTVKCIMDEFANVPMPDDFLTILGTCRGRNIAMLLILQNIAQLKQRFKDAWENILGHCDSFIYLGGNEQSTHKYISEMLGKETIDTRNWGRRFGMHGDSSRNDQIAGRELLTPDEVRTLDYTYAILLIKGELPLIDKKINVFKYKKAKDTAICGNKAAEYFAPLRSERLAANQATKETKAEVQANADIFDATVIGNEEVSNVDVKILLNGRLMSISEQEAAIWLQEYVLDNISM